MNTEASAGGVNAAHATAKDGRVAVSAPPAAETTRPYSPGRWGLRSSINERAVTLEYAGGTPGEFWLIVHEHRGAPSAEARLDAVQLRALGTAARLMSGAQQEDFDAVRRDERDRLARLFEDNREILASFPKDAGSVIDLICLLLRMGHKDADAVVQSDQERAR